VSLSAACAIVAEVRFQQGRLRTRAIRRELRPPHDDGSFDLMLQVIGIHDGTAIERSATRTTRTLPVGLSTALRRRLLRIRFLEPPAISIAAAVSRFRLAPAEFVGCRDNHVAKDGHP